MHKTLWLTFCFLLLALAACAPRTPPTPAAQQSSPSLAAATSTPTAQPPTQEIAFVGSDGNIWRMVWPLGTPARLTSDAQAEQVRYSGLVWSPDGARLAALRETGPQSAPTADALLLFAPAGTLLAQVALAAPPVNTPFAWSPDSTLLAYRAATGQVDQTGSIVARLTLLDAQSGATTQTLLYRQGRGGGCGGAFSPLVNAAMAAHNAYLGVDTLTWAPDQHSLLVAPACGNSTALRVDLASGQSTPGEPLGARYQPGSAQTLLGLWYDQAGCSAGGSPAGAGGCVVLGLTDASGAHQRELASEPLTQAGLVTTLGLASWAADGQTIYYERDNGLWQIGADGSKAHQIIAGAPTDSQGQAIVLLLPSPSPDGARLLYLQLRGANNGPGVGPISSQCFVAQPDGANPVSLPEGATLAVWRP
jgi:hypothetical protein